MNFAFMARRSHAAVHVALLGFLAGIGRSATPIAGLRAIPAAVDFGQVAPNQTLVAVVKLQNKSARALAVTSVDASCGCTTATLAKNTLSPGEATDLTVRVETNETLGALRRTVVLHADAGQTSIPVRLVVVTPGDWNFEQWPPALPGDFSSRSAKGTISLLYRGKGFGRIDHANSSVKWLRITQVLSEPGRTVIGLTRLAGAPPGDHVVRLNAATTDPETPDLPIDVMVPVYHDLALSPNPLLMPATKVGDTTTATIRLLHWLPTSLPRLELAHGAAALTSVGTDDEGILYTVALSPPAAGDLQEPLRVYDGTQLLLTAPVTVHVAPSVAVLPSAP